ncbi:MAG: hypothetical protein V3W44_10735 [Dehalococcoidales bacterium]
MPYDVHYNAGLEGGPDNIMGADNNYEVVTGAACKVGRCVVAEAKLIDGEWIGNLAWTKLARAQDTPGNRQLLVYHTENSVKWLVGDSSRPGEIKDLVVTADDPAYLTGVGLLVTFTDVRTGDVSTLGFIAPWGHV